jgi:hypothetical protein
MTRCHATKDDLASFDKDKAVDDNIVESWLCIDCGVNTHPGTLSGPEIRIAFAMGAESVPYSFNNNTEVYHVKDAVWKQAGMRGWNGCLCVGCLERRLGRQLRPKDFAPHDKTWRELPSTDRLLDRRGLAIVTVQTADGPKECLCDKEIAPLIAGKFVEEGSPPEQHKNKRG